MLKIAKGHDTKYEHGIWVGAASGRHGLTGTAVGVLVIEPLEHGWAST